MLKTIRPEITAIQNRFFEVLDEEISKTKAIGGLKGFCEKHNLNRVKYANIRSEMNKPKDHRKETNYKIIDLDALTYLCSDFGVSPEWLLFGTGEKYKK
ncbi:hypothetical protein [Capnocytophaga canis]|uniref:hypothetical protein n=1 Tax=Capnocytophaga canis TaxID=1848903 RepID=UPI0037CDA15A